MEYPSAAKRRASASPLPGPTPTTAHTGRLLASAIAENLLTPSPSLNHGPSSGELRSPPSPRGRRDAAPTRPLSPKGVRKDARLSTGYGERVGARGLSLSCAARPRRATIVPRRA